MKHPQTTTEFLAAVKAAHGIESDYALAKLMKVGRAAVSHWQTGKRLLDTRACFRVAELLADQPAAVIAAVEMERAEKAGADADEWRGWAKKIAGGAMSVLLAAGLGGFSNADARLAQQQKTDSMIIVSTKKKRKKATPWSGLLPGFAVAF